MEELGRKLGFTMDTGNFHNVSLGQGQEVVAEEAMEKAADHGQWVVLQESGVRILNIQRPPHERYNKSGKKSLKRGFKSDCEP